MAPEAGAHVPFPNGTRGGGGTPPTKSGFLQRGSRIPSFCHFPLPQPPSVPRGAPACCCKDSAPCRVLTSLNPVSLPWGLCTDGSGNARPGATSSLCVNPSPGGLPHSHVLLPAAQPGGGAACWGAVLSPLLQNLRVHPGFTRGSSGPPCWNSPGAS